MKTVEEIYREMMDRFSQETGMEPNGTGEMAVRMYALAAQVYGLYEELAWTAGSVFPRRPQGKNWKSMGFCGGLPETLPGRPVGPSASLSRRRWRRIWRLPKGRCV